MFLVDFIFVDQTEESTDNGRHELKWQKKGEDFKLQKEKKEKRTLSMK